MVRQVVEAVEVAAQPLFQDGQHQDLPQVHSGTPDRAVGIGKNVFIQQRKQSFAQCLVRPDVLKPFQHRRDVVPRLRVDLNLVDRHLTDLELPFLDFSHGVNTAKNRPNGSEIVCCACKNTTFKRSSSPESAIKSCKSIGYGFSG